MSSTTGTTSGTVASGTVTSGGTVNPLAAAGAAVTSNVTAEATKAIGFFEAHPKAIAIGSGIAGALAVLIVQHFI